MKALLLLLTIFLTLSATPHQAYSPEMNKVINEEIPKMIEDFYKEFPYATKAPVYVTPLAPRFAAGYADIFANYVVLNARYLMRYYRTGRLKGLVYHELGHLVLDLSHTKNPKTIMSEGPAGELLITPKRLKIMKKRHLWTCLGYLPSLTDLMLGKSTKPHKSCENRRQMVQK